MEFFRFIFENFWRFIGFIIILHVIMVGIKDIICSFFYGVAYVIKKAKKEKKTISKE